MQIAITKKLSDKLKIGKLQPVDPPDSFYTWRANITQSGHCRLLVFMHEASRYMLVVQRPLAKDFKHIQELFLKTLRGALLLEQINPAVVERYIAEAGEITFTANSGKKETTCLNKACRYAWYGFDENYNNDYLSVFPSHIRLGDLDKEPFAPSQIFIEMLSRYDLPVKSSVAYDLTIRLELGGTEAVRHIRVPANITFTLLHKIIQNAYCWQNYHLFRFCFYEDAFNYYSKPDLELISIEKQFIDDESEADAILTHDVCLSDYLPKWKICMYNYDYGDNWYHFIELTKVHTYHEGDMPLMLFGSGDAPPEDVGGISGFKEFRRIITSPNDDEYEEMISWANMQHWEPFNFDKTAKKVQSALWR